MTTVVMCERCGLDNDSQYGSAWCDACRDREAGGIAHLGAWTKANEDTPQHEQQRDVLKTWRRRDYEMRRAAAYNLIPTGDGTYSSVGRHAPYDYEDPTAAAVLDALDAADA